MQSIRKQNRDTNCINDGKIKLTYVPRWRECFTVDVFVALIFIVGRVSQTRRASDCSGSSPYNIHLRPDFTSGHLRQRRIRMENVCRKIILI
jgi:hypothetical protein